MKQVRISRRFPTIIFLLTALSFVFIAENAIAQNDSAQSSDERERGIKLYQNGEYQSAISVLQTIVKLNKKDGEAFYYLGAAQMQTNQTKAAQKSFKNAAKLLPQDARPTKGLAYAALRNDKLKEAKKLSEASVALRPNDGEAHYLLAFTNYQTGNLKIALEEASRAVELNSTFAPAYLLKTEAMISNGDNWYAKSSPAERTQRFAAAIEVLEKYPALSENSIQVAQLRDKLESLKIFADYFKKRETLADDSFTSAAAMPPNPNETPLNIISKSRASYTEDARRHGVQGTIQLLILFSSGGKVSSVIVLKGLSRGLTEEAVKVARKIQFEPMKIDGKPTSTVKLVEYSFAMY